MKLCSPYFRHQIFIMVPQQIPTSQNPTMGFDSNDRKQLGICQRRIPTILNVMVVTVMIMKKT